MSVLDEIREQPEVIARVLDSLREPATAIAAQLDEVDLVVIAARGTSDHAALYAHYLLGVWCGLPVVLASPSIFSVYHAPMRLGRAAVVGISQSGASPDVAEVLAAARRAGVPTIAITNAPSSRLASEATHVMDIRAGVEASVPATKTYSAELMAVALLSLAMARRRGSRVSAQIEDHVAELPQLMVSALGAEGEAAAAAVAIEGVDRCVVLGRGFGYPTAREWALKLKEMAQVLADPYSAADFEHGPRTLVSPSVPVLAVATTGGSRQGVVDLVTRLREEQGAPSVLLSDRPGDGKAGGWWIPVPEGVPDELSPIVSIVGAQLFAYHLAIAGGRDPDSPPWLNKVTLTR